MPPGEHISTSVPQGPIIRRSTLNKIQGLPEYLIECLGHFPDQLIADIANTDGLSLSRWDVVLIRKVLGISRPPGRPRKESPTPTPAPESLKEDNR